jgi:light-regulated signal transduction histidine kinase (bacteriophytochrome)
LIEDSNAKIEFESMPTINGIPFQLRQLFINLINNSIKYKKINSDPVREDCLEPKTLEEREQALLKGNDPHEESISSPHEESHFVYSDQEVILPSE